MRSLARGGVEPVQGDDRVCNGTASTVHVEARSRGMTTASVRTCALQVEGGGPGGASRRAWTPTGPASSEEMAATGGASLTGRQDASGVAVRADVTGHRCLGAKSRKGRHATHVGEVVATAKARRGLIPAVGGVR